MKYLAVRFALCTKTLRLSIQNFKKDEALYIPPPKKMEIDPQNFLPQTGEIVTREIATGNCLPQINIRGTVRCAVKRIIFILLCFIYHIQSDLVDFLF
jgi:hypothetical protein